MDVILASHAHHVPQVGFPQIDPVTRAIKVKSIPEGAKLFETIIKFLFLNIKIEKDNRAITEYIPREIQAAGT